MNEENTAVIDRTADAQPEQPESVTESTLGSVSEAVPGSEQAKTPESITAEAPEEKPLTRRQKRKAKKLKKKNRMFEVTAETDIRYHPPLSYRHIKFIAWLLLILAQLKIVTEKFSAIDSSSAGGKVLSFITDKFSEFAVPLLLISCLAVIMNGQDQYKGMIIRNASLAVVMGVLTIFIYERYLLRSADVYTALFSEGDTRSAEQVLRDFVSTHLHKGFLDYNIFVDLLLCTLTMFFVNYNPTRFFTGRKIYLFRAMVLLPLGYEVGSIILKILATEHIIKLPVYMFPLLTTKPPMCFLMFLSIAVYFKRREKKFIKHGKTTEDYQEFLKTNYNTFQISKLFIRKIFVYGILDLILFVFIAAFELVLNNMPSEDDVAFAKAMDNVYSWGIGHTVLLLFITPVLLLFSYTKKHDKPIIDVIIPLASAVLIFLIYFDTLFGFVCDSITSFA